MPDTRRVVSKGESTTDVTITAEGVLKLDGADDRGSPTTEEESIEVGSV